MNKAALLVYKKELYSLQVTQGYWKKTKLLNVKINEFRKQNCTRGLPYLYTAHNQHKLLLVYLTVSSTLQNRVKCARSNYA